jgi:hypothetical protein
MLTHNLNTALGLVNGATGTIFDILLDPAASTHTSSNAPGCVFVNKPVVVLFRPDNAHPSLRDFCFPNLDHFPPGLVPIYPRPTSLKFSFPTGDGDSVVLNLTRHQLDLELSYAITDYKCQGKTFQYAIVDFTPPPTGKEDPNSNYVIISRLAWLKGLLILRPFPKHAFECTIPPRLQQQLQKETTRSQHCFTL